MLVFGKLTLALLHIWFVLVMILYMTYMESRWIGGDSMSLETSWICALRREDMLSILFSLASYIVLTDLESRQFIFVELL